MKKTAILITMLLIGLVTFAQSSYTYVNGYTRSNGTYVQAHYRTLPNNTLNDNWSTIGNVNPFTGIAGTKRGDSYYSTSSYNNYSIPSYTSSSYYNSINSIFSTTSNYANAYTTSNYYSNYSAPNYNTTSYYNSSLYSSSITVSTTYNF